MAWHPGPDNCRRGGGRSPEAGARAGAAESGGRTPAHDGRRGTDEGARVLDPGGTAGGRARRRRLRNGRARRWSRRGSVPRGHGVEHRSPASAPAPAATLVELSVTGGFAGVRDVVVVREDGTYLSHRKQGKVTSGRMEAAELDRLRDALDAARFTALPAEVTSAPVADGFTYRITHRGHAVTTSDPVPLPGLSAVLAALPAR
ncbi:hypothetical protein ACFQ60_07430 [Streptomyces zhihengii]